MHWKIAFIKEELHNLKNAIINAGLFRRYRRWRQAVENALAFEKSKRKRQLKCSHLKGMGLRSVASLDYHVGMHTFINNSKRIRCHVCGRIWLESDPDWNTALYMIRHSTNKPSSSEIPAKFLGKVAVKLSLWNKICKFLGYK